MYTACATGNLAAVEELVTADPAVVNTNLDLEQAPLHVAVENGHLDLVKFLVRAGAVINARNIIGETPLHLVTGVNQFGIAKYLIENRAEINAKDKFGWTPLNYIVLDGKLDTVELLVKMGADINAKDEFGWTPLYGAARNGHIDVVKFLAANGADINAKTIINGQTPLEYAAFAGELDTVLCLWLLTCGADNQDESKTICDLDHAARMCLLLGECGLSSDMITFP
jgi:ankyrin repeat protein